MLILARFCNPSHFNGKTVTFAAQLNRSHSGGSGNSSFVVYPMSWDLSNNNIPGVDRTAFYNKQCGEDRSVLRHQIFTFHGCRTKNAGPNQAQMKPSFTILLCSDGHNMPVFYPACFRDAESTLRMTSALWRGSFVGGEEWDSSKAMFVSLWDFQNNDIGKESDSNQKRSGLERGRGLLGNRCLFERARF